MACQNPVVTLESLQIGETLEFIDWGIRSIETVVARTHGITITRNVSGNLAAWKNGANTGWIFAASTTHEAAIERVAKSASGWAGLARGTAIADKHA